MTKLKLFVFIFVSFDNIVVYGNDIFMHLSKHGQTDERTDKGTSVQHKVWYFYIWIYLWMHIKRGLLKRGIWTYATASCWHALLLKSSQVHFDYHQELLQLYGAIDAEADAIPIADAVARLDDDGRHFGCSLTGSDAADVFFFGYWNFIEGTQIFCSREDFSKKKKQQQNINDFLWVLIFGLLFFYEVYEYFFCWVVCLISVVWFVDIWKIFSV